MENSSIHLYNFLKVLRISFQSLNRRKLRSVLSILGIICGVAAVLSMISIGEGTKKTVLQQIEQLGIHNIYVKSLDLTDTQQRIVQEYLSEGLSVSDKDRLKIGCPMIGDIACLKEVTASVLGIQQPYTPNILSVTENYHEMVNIHIQDGRFLSQLDIQHQHLVCVIGSGVAEKIGNSSRVGNDIRIENHFFKIVGIISRLAESGVKSAVPNRNYNETVFIPLGTEKLITTHQKPIRNELSELIIHVADTKLIGSAEKIIERILEITHHSVKDYQIIVPLELLEQTKHVQKTLTLFLSAIATIALLVGGIGVMNMMLVTVSERTKEIGIRRAVGATQTDIMFQFLTESVVLTGLGGFSGMIVGWAIIVLLNHYSELMPKMTWTAFLLPFGMSIVVGLIFGLYPAYKASQMDPITALRYE